jgi:LmbE family N-acetylglucosaminyl deacetylase
MSTSPGPAGGPLTVEDLGTVLGIWAHPDDEAYLSAGLMLAARRAGQRVVVLTATAGELGSPDLGTPPARLAAQRAAELRASLASLGVEEHHLLGLPDGGCERLTPGPVVETLRGWIDRVEPDTIVTFGPEGMTGHPDHRAVHRWSLDAWRSTGQAARLLWATVTPEFHAEWGAQTEALGIWEGEVPCTPTHELALAVDCGPRLDEKLAALLAHDSQVRPLVEAIGLDAFRRWWATESFVAAPAPPLVERTP